jgi:hypothetical protein
MNALPTNIDISSARLPATYEQAKLALASCERIDECWEWANKAEALASYAKWRMTTLCGSLPIASKPVRFAAWASC